ncbi:unnamed protein product [Gadus morhua 'NCC']
MGNYRNKLRVAGCSELQVNRRSSGPKQKTKKARKAEVNFLPDFPEGRTQNVLEEERLATMEEMKKKKADMKKVNEIMVSTFSLRRKQIVEEPPVVEVKTKWPALFTEQQIEAEFTRITSADLRGSFFSGLGQHLPRLLQLYRTSSFPELKKVLSMLEEDYGLPHPAPFDFEYELPYTLQAPADDCVPAEPDIYHNLSRWAAPFPSPPTASPPSHLKHPRRPDQGSAFRYQGLRPAPLRLEGTPGCIRFWCSSPGPVHISNGFNTSGAQCLRHFQLCHHRHITEISSSAIHPST